MKPHPALARRHWVSTESESDAADVYPPRQHSENVVEGSVAFLLKHLYEQRALAGREGGNKRIKKTVTGSAGENAI